MKVAGRDVIGRGLEKRAVGHELRAIDLFDASPARVMLVLVRHEGQNSAAGQDGNRELAIGVGPVVTVVPYQRKTTGISKMRIVVEGKILDATEERLAGAAISDAAADEDAFQ